MHIGKEKRAKELIIESILHTNSSKEYFLSFKEFDPFREVKLFPEISDNYEKYVSQFYTNLKHPEIYREIDSLVKKDQEVRKIKSKNDQMAMTDSLNINRLIEITKQYG